MQDCGLVLRRGRWLGVTFAAFLVFALFLGAKPAFADNNDHVSFAQRIVIDQNETADDLVCFMCTIENHGTVQGDVVSFLGGVKSDGAIHGDLVSFLGDVNVAGSGSVGGDVVVLGGSLRKSENGQLGQNQVVFPFAVFVIPFIILGAILWGITRIFRRRPIYYPTVGR